MTSFAVKGTRGGREIMVFWNDGELSGDPDAVKMIKHLAKDADGKPIWTPGHSGPLFDHLSDCYQAYALMKMVFPKRPEMIGSLPPLPPPPPGAIY
jgi:hypothetical protein